MPAVPSRLVPFGRAWVSTLTAWRLVDRCGSEASGSPTSRVGWWAIRMETRPSTRSSTRSSVRPAWGRVYGEVGLLIAGVYTQGPDRGVAQGLHGGLGADLYSGGLMWNVNARLLWLQRNSGENVFGVQLGVSLSPRLGRSGVVGGGKGR